jgi:glycosyltransferase involved in cell wall biosynthesis
VIVRVAVNVEQLLHEAPGGIGRYTAELLRLLPTLQVDVTPFTARHPAADVERALRDHGLDGFDPVILPLPAAVLYDAWHVLGVAGPARRVAPVDLVHAPSPAVPPSGGLPLVVTVHDAAPLVIPDAFTRRGVRFHRRGFAAAAKRARLVIAVSEFCADEVTTYTAIPRDRIRVVPNGVHRERATAEAVRKARLIYAIDDKPYVFWAGTFQPRKNVRVLLDAFTRLERDATVPHRLVLAGPPGWKPDDADAEVADALGDRVRLLGPVHREQLYPLFAGADLYALPSRHEGFGIPALEAMAQETPVLCSDIPALREVAGEAARYVAPDDLDGWVDALTTLLCDEAARAALVAKGSVRVANYSWERCARETAAVYREALNG